MKTPAFALLPILLISAPAAAEAPAPLPDGKEVFAKIIERHRAMYEKYKGIEVKVESTTWMYDSETGKLKETVEMTSVGAQYFYEQPGEPKVLRYAKDGKELSPEEYEHRGGGEPMLPMFDAEGQKNYTLEVLDRANVKGTPALAVRVLAKEKTKRHFEGMVYVDAETLDPIYMDGGMADTMFGVDSMRFQFYMKKQGDIYTWTTSDMTAEIDIPIIFPDTLMLSKSTVLESKGIPK